MAAKRQVPDNLGEVLLKSATVPEYEEAIRLLMAVGLLRDDKFVNRCVKIWSTETKSHAVIDWHAVKKFIDENSTHPDIETLRGAHDLVTDIRGTDPGAPAAGARA